MASAICEKKKLLKVCQCIRIKILENIQFVTLLAIFFPERTISGVDLLERHYKVTLSHSIPTMVNFQDFRRLTTMCVQLANVPL